MTDTTMTLTLIILGGVVAFFTSAALVAIIRRRAEALGLVQHPDHRASHSIPTPTGGGLGIVVGAILGALLSGWSNQILLPALVIGAAIAVMGLIDDRWKIPAMVRLPLQLAGILAFVILSGATRVLGDPMPDMWVVAAGFLLVIAGVWWLNLFNFQDGIDGYAGSQALFMVLASLLLSLPVLGGTPDTTSIALSVALTGAVAAFLAFNWPPAKIFMGDAGSTFLGFILFALAALTHLAGSVTIWQWAILGVVFVADATVTLVRRGIRGEKIMQAHRSHAYQRLSRRWNGHRPVTLALIGINMVIVLPLAWMAGQWPDSAAIVICIVYLFALTMALLLGAGQESA